MSRPAIGFINVRIVPAANSRQFTGRKRVKNAKWNGEPMRKPLRGELYLSGARGFEKAYEAPADMSTEYFIAEPCNG